MKKKVWVSLLAVLTALVGIAVVVAAFLRKKGKKLKDDLDFDESVYFEDDDEQQDDLLDDYSKEDSLGIGADAGMEPDDADDEEEVSE